MSEKEPKRRSCTTCPQYDGASCEATGVWLGDKNRVLQDERRHGFICHDTGETEAMLDNITSRLVDDTMYHPNSATADCIVDMLRKGEGGPFTSVFPGAKMPDGIIHMVDCSPAHVQFQYRPEALLKYAGSPSSECPSLREGPPQKGKIDENNPSDAPVIPSGTIVAGEGIQVIENPGPMWKDTNGYWEPIKPRSCTTCKFYNDPICMQIATHIGTREEMWAREKRDGFQCIAALPKEERHLAKTNHVIL